MDNDVSCVYMIQNEVNKKVYIGSTKDLKNRLNRHFHLLKNGKHDSKRLQEDWDKYGSECFKIYILEITIEDNELLKSREQFYIDKYDSSNESKGYNIFHNAKSPLGYKHSDETKQKLSELQKGVNNGFYGKKHTEESKRKISEAHIGKTITESQRKGLEIGKGTTYWTEETYKKLSEKNRGENSATAKLTESEVIEILEHLKNKTKTWKEIAETYGISITQISRIKNGERWSYIKNIRGDLYE